MTSPWRFAVAVPRQIVVHVCAGCGWEQATYEGETPRGWVYREGAEWCGRRLKGERCLPGQRMREPRP